MNKVSDQLKIERDQTGWKLRIAIRGTYSERSRSPKTFNMYSEKQQRGGSGHAAVIFLKAKTAGSMWQPRPWAYKLSFFGICGVLPRRARSADRWWHEDSSRDRRQQKGTGVCRGRSYYFRILSSPLLSSLSLSLSLSLPPSLLDC